MSDLTRAEAIAELTEHLNHWQRLMKEGICGKEQGERTIKSFELAIDSLKTDEAYQIEYENRDFIEIPEGATNGNMMLKLFPNSKYKVVDNGIEFKGIIDDNTEFTTWFPIEWWNSPYRKEQE